MAKKQNTQIEMSLFEVRHAYRDMLKKEMAPFQAYHDALRELVTGCGAEAVWEYKRSGAAYGRELRPDELVAEGDYVRWMEYAWTTVDKGSEYIGRTPEELALPFRRRGFEKYTALGKRDSEPIVTVLADSLGDAFDKVRVELSGNPSRRAYLDRWEKYGSRVRAADGSVHREADTL